MSYINRAPKYQLADILAQNSTSYELNKQEYQEKSAEELEKLRIQIYRSNLNKYMRMNEENLRKKIKEDRFKKIKLSQPSDLELEVQRKDSLIKSSDSSQTRLF